MFKSKLILKLGVMFIAGAIGIIALTGSATTAKVSNNNFDKVVTTNADGKYTLIGAAKVSSQPENDVIIEMHKMANNYVNASETWGTQEMTQERLNALIVETLSHPSTTEYQHKARLLEILTDWKKGDFTHLAADHNYVWDCLFGTVGKATGVKEKKDLPAWSIGK
ncbi:MAG TPA: hypothetical protein DD730_14630 [Desulfosporosinus sp.]|jgi:hypothetical protein|nr:hypothetical protein [Desulfosporosinus sp.]